MRSQRNVFQMKKYGKKLEKEQNEQTSNLLDKEFKTMIRKMFDELRRRTDEFSEIFNRKRKYFKKKSELKNRITEI